MAKDTQEKDYYKKLHEVSQAQWDKYTEQIFYAVDAQETIPLKWTAIEALTDKIFTHKSDV